MPIPAQPPRAAEIHDALSRVLAGVGASGGEPGDLPQAGRDLLARFAIDHLHEFVAVLAPDGTLLEANQSALVGGGLRSEEIVGRPFWEARWWTASPETQARLQGAVRLAAAGELPRYDVDVLGGDGGRRLVTLDLTLHPVRGADDAVVFLVAEGRDVSERKRAEAELAELRAPLSLVLGPIERLLEAGDLTPDQRHALAVAERNARTVMERVTALPEVNRIERDGARLDRAAGDLSGPGRIAGGEAPEGGPLRAVEPPLAAPAGLEAKAAPAPRDARPLVVVVEDSAEMSELLRAALAADFRTAAARSGEEGLRLARELRPDLVLTDVVMRGGRGDELVRALRADASLASVPILVLTAKADDALRARLLSEGAQDYVAKPVALAELRARVRNLVAMKRARDVLREELVDQAEDVERLAGELARRKRELQTALDAMRFAREQADRASAQKTTLIRLVSHELRTPLSALLLQVERMRRDAAHLSPHHRDAVARMRAATQRLTGLVESLLEYARIETGRMRLEPERLDAARLAADVVDELRPQAAQKALALHGPVPGTLPLLETDARLLRLVLLNLVSNGIKFTEAGAVTVSVRVEGGEHHLVVADTGRGIAREDQARIFEPFEQLEAISLKHTPGVGLGLALVREMVNALGGIITLASTPGEGSVFRVALPSTPRAPQEWPAGAPAAH